MVSLVGSPCWALVEAFAMACSMSRFYASSRCLSIAFADDLRQIRQAAYALRQYELWNLCCNFISYVRLERAAFAGCGYEPSCGCYLCRPGSCAELLSPMVPCTEVESVVFRFGPYMLAAPYMGLEWTVDGRLYWPVDTRWSSDYAAFVATGVYLNDFSPIRFEAHRHRDYLGEYFYASLVRGRRLELVYQADPERRYRRPCGNCIADRDAGRRSHYRGHFGWHLSCFYCGVYTQFDLSMHGVPLPDGANTLGLV